MGNRKSIPLKVQLAAALLQLVDARGQRLVPHSDAKLMTADQIISLYQRDHYPVRVVDGGPDEPWNITWRLRAEHKTKTVTIDQPQIAKQRRIRSREDEHAAVMTEKLVRATIKRKIPSRPFPKGRKFAGR